MSEQFSTKLSATRTTKRILVALDTSQRGRAALEAAVQLAISTSAELQGLFVEDEDLVRLASLPFAREVDLTSASARELQLAKMERALHSAAAEAQQVFAAALRQRDLNWSFRIVRGTVTQASLAAAGDVDLLVIGQRGRSPRILGREYLPKSTGDGRRPLVVFDGSASAFHALDLAHNLAKSSPIVVLVLAQTGGDASRQCMAWLKQHNVRAEVDQALQPTEQAIVDFARKWPPSAIFINRDSTFVSNAQISRLVDEFECPLILC